ncbi:hypothetical protein AWB76_02805 [Caballeronia temeraria]|uniref:Uncharacterized protein n=1 Tax=Caballeronia temeraria TaxID=1777137 RepID=A0A158APS0_9BURK|nr:hypothetical protein AWB76_02805 [Caballeronia temeraria]
MDRVRSSLLGARLHRTHEFVGGQRKKPRVRRGMKERARPLALRAPRHSLQRESIAAVFEVFDAKEANVDPARVRVPRELVAVR